MTTRDRIANALLTTRRTDYEGATNHRQHRYDARCALCAGDVDALADAVLSVLPASSDQVALRDRTRALALLEAANFLRDAHGQLSAQEIGTALRHTADEADPMVGSLARDGFGLNEIAAMLDTPVPPASIDRAAVLREAAEKFERECPDANGSMDLCMCHAAEPLRQWAAEEPT